MSHVCDQNCAAEVVCEEELRAAELEAGVAAAVGPSVHMIGDTLPILTAREMPLVGGWGASAASLDVYGVTIFEFAHGATREDAIEKARAKWKGEKDRREREAALAALAGDERPRRRQRRR